MIVWDAIININNVNNFYTVVFRLGNSLLSNKHEEIVAY